MPLLIGVVAGLRTLTAPAAVSWAAHLGWQHLECKTWLAFLGAAVLGPGGDEIIHSILDVMYAKTP